MSAGGLVVCKGSVVCKFGRVNLWELEGVF